MNRNQLSEQQIKALEDLKKRLEKPTNEENPSFKGNKAE